MAATSPGDVTRLLAQVETGNDQAVADLLELVYSELRTLASQQMAGERASHTLQPTALVHEAFLRLLCGERQTLHNRAHFFGAAANAMRRILVDHARAHLAAKRGGDRIGAALEENAAIVAADPAVLVAVDEALGKLAAFDEQKSRIVQLRFFAGLSVEETAELLGISDRTVKREWRYARAWLYREIGDKS